MEKTGEKRPWKSQERFPLSHSFNNNKLDDRNHFLQNAKTSVASLRRLITPTRNADHDQPGTLITFIGIRTRSRNVQSSESRCFQLNRGQFRTRLSRTDIRSSGRTWNTEKEVAEKVGFGFTFSTKTSQLYLLYPNPGQKSQ